MPLMEQKILLRGARQLLTLRGPQRPRRGSQMDNLAVIEDGALLILDGVIQDVGPSRRVENLAAARNAVEISADGRVVMPGFVDARTQLVSGPPLLADYSRRVRNGEPSDAVRDEEILSGAIRSSSRPRLEMTARKALREFVRHGTTTLEAHSGLGWDAKHELKSLRAIDRVSGRPLDVLATYFGAVRRPGGGESADGYLDRLVEKVLPKIRRSRLATAVDARLGEGGFAAEEVHRYLRAARKMGFWPRVTSSEFVRDEGVAVAVAVGAASVDHLEMIGDEDIRMLARSETVANLLPGASYHRLRQRYGPARGLIDGGAPVAISTGYSSDRCPTCSMPAIISLACTQMQMTPEEAITGATFNAASALGLADRIGSIEFGKRADLIMLNVADYREIPYHFGMNLVAMMMKQGDVIYPRMEFPWSGA